MPNVSIYQATCQLYPYVSEEQTRHTEILTNQAHKLRRETKRFFFLHSVKDSDVFLYFYFCLTALFLSVLLLPLSALAADDSYSSSPLLVLAAGEFCLGESARNATPYDVASRGTEPLLVHMVWLSARMVEDVAENSSPMAVSTGTMATRLSRSWWSLLSCRSCTWCFIYSLFFDVSIYAKRNMRAMAVLLSTYPELVTSEVEIIRAVQRTRDPWVDTQVKKDGVQARSERVIAEFRPINE